MDRAVILTRLLAAKKLKKAWIEKAQIKSKWSREKRKLQEQGVIPAVRKPWEIPREVEKEARDSGEDDESAPSRPGQPRRDAEEDESESEAEQRPLKRSKHSSTKNTAPPPPPHLARNDPSSSRSAPRQQRPEKFQPKSSWQDEIQNAPSPKKDFKGKSKALHQADEEEDREQSLRDLKRSAYDKKNLHNFRADPLHKHSGRGRINTARGRGGGGRGLGGPGRGRGGYGGREPRGQPNMKLRMDYMLEKIKRDYAPSA